MADDSSPNPPRVPLYFGNASSDPQITAALADGTIGQMCTPAEGRSPANAKVWAADNGCFGKGYPGDAKWLAWLQRHAHHASRCAFATAPDVVGDAVATMARSLPHLATIRELGYPAALVAQDGLEDLEVPWDEFDVLFIGGSTEWKLGPHAAALVAEAKLRGKWVHVGRVNSQKRFLVCAALGVDSADGTYLTFAPAVNFPKVLGWLDAAAAPTLFDSED